jgi:SAM-dependent methyltransferase
MLDYGCGDGAYAAIEGARNGQKVIAIDLSPVALERARAHAVRAGVADAIDFRVMNAEALDLEDDQFDFVCGYGVIHHLEITPALREIARVLKPDGAAMFAEPMGHNPAINLYRNRTPDQRTPDEHPLLSSDLPLFEAQFDTVRETYFHLAGLLALPLLSTKYFDGVLSALDRLDTMLMRTAARKWAWMVVLELSGPRPVAA